MSEPLIHEPARVGAAKSPVAAASGAEGGDEIAGYYEAYAAFARTLRTWLVGFGVGVPVLVASQADLGKALRDSGEASLVLGLYLAGVSVQIAATLLYKAAMWYTYFGSTEPAFKSTRRYKRSCWVADKFWLEFLIDIATIGLFAAATSVLLHAVV